MLKEVLVVPTKFVAAAMGWLVMVGAVVPAEMVNERLVDIEDPPGCPAVILMRKFVT